MISADSGTVSQYIVNVLSLYIKSSVHVSNITRTSISISRNYMRYCSTVNYTKMAINSLACCHTTISAVCFSHSLS